MFKWLNKLFKSEGELRKWVEKINALESAIQKLDNQQLLGKSLNLKSQARQTDDLDKILPEAFALVRETAKRTLNQRHFDVQLMGGFVLYQGKIVEMRTGEGKTLSATLPAYLNALGGKGVHVVTVNEYLAKRDAVWMGQIYHALGLSVACLAHEGALIYDPDFRFSKSQISNLKSQNANAENPQHQHKESALLDKERDITGSFLVQQEYLRPISRKEAYQADITYGTNHEFGFDYLRDNLIYRLEDQVQRERNYAIIDEVDSILIDEARTPLIISAPDAESSQHYKTFARLVQKLEKNADYLVDEKLHSVEITQEGIDKVEKMLGIQNLYGPENLRLTHYLLEVLKANALFQRDKDYVVKNGEIIIVDQFTGRLMMGRRYSGGLHQAIEAKEGLAVQNESRTYASISIQNYFRMYKKISGMTGTAQTSAEEFHKVYNLEAVTIPTNQPMIRKDLSDLIYKTRQGKYEAIAKEVKERREKGQPILLGTVSIQHNEELSRALKDYGIPHEILNAKNHEREGAIIAQAGKKGAVTVATNMAGRGVDIVLGGNPPDILETEAARGAGGLHVIGTERHESRRIDNQLRGRAGRQGDSGSSQFFLSLEDDLMRVFGGERIQGLMRTLKVPEDMPIKSGLLTKVIAQAQGRVEGLNFDARKRLLEYDDVLNKQRNTIYKKRREILTSGKARIAISTPPAGQADGRQAQREVSDDSRLALSDSLDNNQEIILSPSAIPNALNMLDLFWMNHLESMETLSESVKLRAYGQHDPLVEYRREGHMLFQQLLKDFDDWILKNEQLLKENSKSQIPNPKQIQDSNDQSSKQLPHGSAVSQRESAPAFPKVGRNDPCPCGSGKKYKKCHGQ